MSQKPEVLSAVYGIAPRSNELLKLGADVDRGRASPADYSLQCAQEAQDWRNLQIQEGIDLVADAKLDWQDHLRPIVAATEGFTENIDEAPVTRWYETNTFYRRPCIEGPLTARPDKLPELTEQFIDLIAPYTFADLCDNNSEESDLDNVENLYEQLVDHYAEKGVKNILLREYSSQSAADRMLNDIGLSSVIKLADKYPDINFGYFSSAQYLEVLPVISPANLGFKVLPETIKNLGKFGAVFPPGLRNFSGLNGKDIWSPVVRADNTLVDDTTKDKWATDYLRGLSPARLILTNTVDFQHIPLKYAREKIRWLAEETNQVKERLGE